MIEIKQIVYKQSDIQIIFFTQIYEQHYNQILI